MKTNRLKYIFLTLFVVLLSTVSYAQKKDRGESELVLAEEYFVNEDYAKAVPLLQKASEKGSVKAMFLLGILYVKGAGGLPKKEFMGMAKIRNAASNGCDEAMVWMMTEYVENNNQMAVGDFDSYIEILMKKNHPKGFYYGGLFNLYDTENRDERKGVQYLLKAAELGDADAEYELAMCCIDDLGDAGNYEDALKWLEKSSEHGNGKANQYLIFKCY